MKKIVMVFAVFFVFPLAMCFSSGVREAAVKEAPKAGVILDHYAAPRNGFAEGKIPEADLDIIVQTGIRAPSAVNIQPWFFTVIKDIELAKKVVSQAVEGNVVIVISTEGNANKVITDREIIDCALATQSIYLAAQALGYGSRIFTGPIANVNETLKGELGFPPDRRAVAAVWVGRVSADAAGTASPRKAADEIVTFK